MRKLLLAGAASIAALCIPANLSAQDVDAEASAGVTAEFEVDAEQQVVYDAWPADRRAAYDSWDAAYQEYFWTLTPTQQEGYWLLNDEQRAQLADMTPEQRTAAWSSIEQQLNRADVAASAPNSADASVTAQAATSAARTASTSQPGSVSGEVAQAAPAPPREYPICKGDNDDSCINPWAAGQRGPGVNRPLDHWPGQPASEMDDRGG